jgi:type IV pilus assembly protein PilX
MLFSPPPQLPQRQSGMALIVVLIFLFLLTLLGVSSMTTSSLEERMASNAQSQMGTFQTAESAIAETMVNNATFTAAVNAPTGTNNSYTLGGHTGSTKTAVDGSINQIMEGYSLGTFQAIPFTIEATSTSAGTGARSRLTQGVKRLAPGAS